RWQIGNFKKTRSSRSPFYIDPLFTAEFVGIEKLLAFDAMFVNEFGHFYIETAIFSDLHQALFAPPFDRIDSVCGLAQAEGGMGDVLQFKFVSSRLLNFQE